MELGIIEGYYGPPWDRDARRSTIAALGRAGYRFFIYAPKADRALVAEDLESLAAACHAAGMRFGVGVTPVGAFATPRLPAIDLLAILFDDIAGGVDPEAQAATVDRLAARTSAVRILVCPTYCSDDPLLDRMLGPRPDRYLERLGAALDPAIDVFWTGATIVADAFDAAHLERVAHALGRQPVLWDNYPVNDGEDMSRFLHLSAFRGRPASNASLVRAHAINPALQPVLTCVPALTLAASYDEGDRYDPTRAFAVAARAVLGEALAAAVQEDLAWFETVGLDALGTEAPRLVQRYAAFDHPAAREIVAWLAGRYRSRIEPLSVP